MNGARPMNAGLNILGKGGLFDMGSWKEAFATTSDSPRQGGRQGGRR